MTRSKANSLVSNHGKWSSSRASVEMPQLKAFQCIKHLHKHNAQVLNISNYQHFLFAATRLQWPSVARAINPVTQNLGLHASLPEKHQGGLAAHLLAVRFVKIFSHSDLQVDQVASKMHLPPLPRKTLHGSLCQTGLNFHETSPRWNNSHGQLGRPIAGDYDIERVQCLKMLNKKNHGTAETTHFWLLSNLSSHQNKEVLENWWTLTLWWRLTRQ